MIISDYIRVCAITVTHEKYLFVNWRQGCTNGVKVWQVSRSGKPLLVDVVITPSGPKQLYSLLTIIPKQLWAKF